MMFHGGGGLTGSTRGGPFLKLNGSGEVPLELEA